MNLSKIISLTGKKIVDIVIWGVVLSALFLGVFYSMGMVTFTFDTNDLMYMGIAFAVGFVLAFVLNKFLGGQGGAAPGGQPGGAPAQPQAPPAAPPQQPAPAQ
jgi:hypothetical protein